jgi:hypothetical protein
MQPIIVLFLTRKGVTVPYDPTVHKSSLYKFLFWEEENLLVAAEQSSFCNTHASITRYVMKCPSKEPDAAGEFSIGGEKMFSWKSLGFDVITPERLKPVILEAFQIS